MFLGINWAVRVRSKQFWLLLIPAVFLIVQIVAGMFGFVIELDDLQVSLLSLVDAVFVLLLILGVSVDVTTPGIGDSPLTKLKARPSSLTKEEANNYLIQTDKPFGDDLYSSDSK